MTSSATLFQGMYSGLWESEAEVVTQLGAKLHQTRERIAEFEHADSLIAPGIREAEAYLRRAADRNPGGGV
jgi:hypothetical protein